MLIERSMYPLARQAHDYVQAWEDGTRRSLAIQHALTTTGDGLWGDHPNRPTSVLLLRRRHDRWNAFGTGDPEPAVIWLAARREPVALLAPESWADALCQAVASPVVQSRLLVRYLPEFDGRSMPRERVGPPIRTRRLTPADAPTLATLGDFEDAPDVEAIRALLKSGAAFGVADHTSLLAAAWICEHNQNLDAIHVHTRPRFRRLGLGHAVVRALIDHILTRRQKTPIWAELDTTPAALALARSLGFVVTLEEPLFRFGAGRFEDHPPSEPSRP